MRVEHIDKRTYAFGLTWIAGRDSAAEDIEAARGGAEDGFVYYVELHGTGSLSGEAPVSERPAPRPRVLSFRSRADAEKVVGFAVEPSRVKDLPCSYAATLAGLKQDGLYIAALPDNQFWYCGVKNGVVVPDTDHVGPRELIRGQVMTMSQGLGLPVYAGPGASIEDSRPFDLVSALDGVRARALRPLQAERKLKTPLIVVGALVLAAFGYRVLFPPKPKITPAQQQAILRQDYLNAATARIGPLPLSSDWVLRAYDTAEARLPAIKAGWFLQGVNCTPTGCRALYATNGHHTFSLSPMTWRFGHAVTVMQNGTSLAVGLPVRTSLRTVSIGLLQSLRPARLPLLDWVGAVPLVMDGGRIDGQLMNINLAGQLGGTSAGMPALFLQQASVKGMFYLDRLSLEHVLRAGARGGFVPVQAAWSPGFGRVPASWRITWERIHG